jgi:hypothetical protein
MNTVRSGFSDIPRHLMLIDRVYKLSAELAENSSRAFDRGLVDFRVEGVNPINPKDKWRTLLGMSEEVYADYPGYKLKVPLEWLLFRFLCHHLRTNSLHILSGPGGEVFKTTNLQSFLGNTIDDDQAEEVLRTVLTSWVRTVPQGKVELPDLYASTDMSLDTLRRALNYLIFRNHIEESGPHAFVVKPSIFRETSPFGYATSLDRKSNRYYQEVSIQANEPFCFVIMPFRNEEFDQRIYFDIIKPLIENEFRISCYRVDEDGLPDRIDNKIYSYLLRSAFILAEVTTLNPNVLYELGIAHMLEKDCIILTQKPNSEVPFDINRISAEPYENDEQLRTYLRRSISALAFKASR